jgi:hypothetical protein
MTLAHAAATPAPDAPGPRGPLGPAPDDRAEELLATARDLWPDPAEVRVGRRGDRAAARAGGGHVVRELLVVPNAARPRLLVPAHAPRAAAAAVRSYAHGTGLAHRLGRTLAAGLVATGLADLVLPDRLLVGAPPAHGGPTAYLEEHLRGLLRPDALIGVRVGSPRANRKPVLPVMGRDGRLLAYVKVGHNDLTRRLVRQEGQALVAVGAARPRTFRAPRVLHEGTWRGFSLLVITPLATPRASARRDRELPAAAMAELASLFGVEECTLGESSFWDATLACVAQVRDAGTRRVLHEVTTTLAARHGTARLRFGAWHGDWAPWNMGRDDDGVLLWDWERCTVGVPLGFDALHYRLQAALVAGQVQDATRAFREQGPAALDLVGVHEERRLVGLLYLLEITLRYVLDAEGPTGEPLRRMAAWSTALLAQEVGAP